jgi:hypothetical protein
MPEVDEIIDAATLREETATICVAGELNAEHETADQALRELNDAGWNPGSLSEVDPRTELVERLRDLERRMREHEYTFRFRAKPWSEYAALKAAHTDPESGDWRIETFAPALVHACAVDPVFRDVAHVGKLFEKLTQAQVDALFMAAWRANQGLAAVPKSARASALTRSSGPKPSAPTTTG